MGAVLDRTCGGEGINSDFVPSCGSARTPRSPRDGFISKGADGTDSYEFREGGDHSVSVTGADGLMIGVA